MLTACLVAIQGLYAVPEKLEGPGCREKIYSSEGWATCPGLAELTTADGNMLCA